MTDPMIQMQMDDHIRAALREDMPFGDVSTAAVMPEPRPGRVQLIAKADGVLRFEKLGKDRKQACVYPAE